MKLWKRLLVGFGVLIVAGIAFVALFGDNVIEVNAVDVARVGNQEVVFSTDCPWGHCTHKIGVRAANAPRISKWWGQGSPAYEGRPG